ISVETFGTEKVGKVRIIELIRKNFDLRPYGLIKMLDLIQPIYLSTAAYGHFGREEFPWEALDKVETLKSDAF
ncbi:S-adenosylmethionine synthetase, partial [Psychromonas sp. PRT-SC03]